MKTLGKIKPMLITRLYTLRHTHEINHVLKTDNHVIISCLNSVCIWKRKRSRRREKANDSENDQKDGYVLRATLRFGREITEVHDIKNVKNLENIKGKAKHCKKNTNGKAKTDGKLESHHESLNDCKIMQKNNESKNSPTTSEKSNGKIFFKTNFLYQSRKKLFNLRFNIKTRLFTKVKVINTTHINESNKESHYHNSDESTKEIQPNDVIIVDRKYLKVNNKRIRHSYGEAISITEYNNRAFIAFENGNVCSLCVNNENNKARCAHNNDYNKNSNFVLVPLFTVNDLPTSITKDEESLYVGIMSGDIFKVPLSEKEIESFEKGDRDCNNDSINDDGVDDQTKENNQHHDDIENTPIRNINRLIMNSSSIPSHTNIQKKVKMVAINKNNLLVVTLCNNLIFLDKDRLTINGYMEEVDGVWISGGVWIAAGCDVIGIDVE